MANLLSPLPPPSSSSSPTTLREVPPPQQEGQLEEGSAGRRMRRKKNQQLSLLPLVFIIYFQVCGGAFGSEDSVRAAGPLLTLLGFTVFPILWSVPEALITAELSTMFTDNGGYVLWTSAAFGPFVGFQQGWWKWLSGVMDNALYPLLFLDYLKAQFPAVRSGPPRFLASLLITTVLTLFNYRGLAIVGWSGVVLGIFSLLPFGVMFCMGIPHFKPSHWVILDLHTIDWMTYFNTLFWNLHYWDSVSTLVGEVKDPQKTLPKALSLTVILVMASYVLPLAGAIGALDVISREEWTDGYFAEIARVIGGAWLGWWMTIASALSNVGMFEAEMSSDSFQLLGMAEQGMLPQCFAIRSRYGTPPFSILASASGILILSWLTFQEIIAVENYLYCFGMLMEFAAFIHLRTQHPHLPRPYKIPLGNFGALLLLLAPTLFIVYFITFSSWKVIIIGMAIGLLGFLIYPLLMLAKKKAWLTFPSSSSSTYLMTLYSVPKASPQDLDVSQV